MRDFNQVCADLIRHLRLCGWRSDGEIWVCDGTLELAIEFLQILGAKVSKMEEKE